MSEPLYIDLLILKGDFVLNTGCEPELCNNRKSIGQDIIHAIIESGLAAGEFTTASVPADIAWRLIALVCGLDGMYVLGIQEMDDPAFDRHLDRMIALELFS